MKMPDLVIGHPLRIKHVDSIKFLLEIPIIFSNISCSKKQIFIDHTRLPCYWAIRSQDNVDLRTAGLVAFEAPLRIPKTPIDYLLFAQEYNRKLDSGEYATSAELARSLGVSRVWVTMIIKRGECLNAKNYTQKLN
jgi:hypothetical protein